MSSKYEKFFTVYAYICKNSDNIGIYDVIIYIFLKEKIYTLLWFFDSKIDKHIVYIFIMEE